MSCDVITVDRPAPDKVAPGIHILPGVHKHEMRTILTPLKKDTKHTFNGLGTDHAKFCRFCIDLEFYVINTRMW